MEYTKALRRVSIIVAALVACAATAHPAHGSPDGESATLFHLLTQPDHLLVLIALVGAIVAAVVILRDEHIGKQRGARGRREA